MRCTARQDGRAAQAEAARGAAPAAAWRGSLGPEACGLLPLCQLGALLCLLSCVELPGAHSRCQQVLEEIKSIVREAQLVPPGQAAALAAAAGAPAGGDGAVAGGAAADPAAPAPVPPLQPVIPPIPECELLGWCGGEGGKAGATVGALLHSKGSGGQARLPAGFWEGPLHACPRPPPGGLPAHLPRCPAPRCTALPCPALLCALPQPR